MNTTVIEFWIFGVKERNEWIRQFIVILELFVAQMILHLSEQVFPGCSIAIRFADVVGGLWSIIVQFPLKVQQKTFLLFGKPNSKQL
jgi:hypothetical protein